MKIFFQTFMICLIICGTFFAWAYFKHPAFNSDFEVNGEVYTNKQLPKEEPQKEEVKKNKKHKLKICFVDSFNQITPITRESEDDNLKTVVKLLLKGTTEMESAKGLYSEIPYGTRLLSIEEENKKIIINLSSDFIKGGGTQSIVNRIKQLVKTVNYNHDKKPVYLYVDDKKVEYVGGEGVYLEQPLNEEYLDSLVH